MRKTWLLARCLLLPCWGAWATEQDIDSDTHDWWRTEVMIGIISDLSTRWFGSLIGGQLGHLLANNARDGYHAVGFFLGSWIRVDSPFSVFMSLSSPFVLLTGLLGTGSMEWVRGYGIGSFFSTFLGASLGALIFREANKLVFGRFFSFLRSIDALRRPIVLFLSSALSLSIWVAAQLRCYQAFDGLIERIVISNALEASLPTLQLAIGMPVLVTLMLHGVYVHWHSGWWATPEELSQTVQESNTTEAHSQVEAGTHTPGLSDTAHMLKMTVLLLSVMAVANLVGLLARRGGYMDAYAAGSEEAPEACVRAAAATAEPGTQAASTAL